MSSMFTTSNSTNIELRVSATPINSSYYQFFCSFGYNGTITRLRFSMIVFDQADV
jgi:tetrahydromethanopterin S-methyltransferase subunit E